MIDAVRVALTAVRTGEAPQAGELAVVPLQGAPDVLLGIDDLRRPHLLLQLQPAESPPSASDVATLEIGARPLVLAGRTERFLDVTCLFQSVADVFEHFVAAVVDRVQVIHSSTSALEEVLEKWRLFLIPAEGPLGREKVAAILGELLVLRDIVRADPIGRLDSWVGPHGGRHDFRRGAVALEVKTTRAHTSREVTVHGEDQLDNPIGGFLYLHFVRLEEVPSAGETLPSVIDDLLSSGAAADRLFEALAASGIPVSELDATGEFSFEVRERLTVPVDDQSPRIVPGSFVGGARPTGVLNLSYVISLDHFLDRALDRDGYQSLVRELAGIT